MSTIHIVPRDILLSLWLFIVPKVNLHQGSHISPCYVPLDSQSPEWGSNSLTSTVNDLRFKNSKPCFWAELQKSWKRLEKRVNHSRGFNPSNQSCWCILQSHLLSIASSSNYTHHPIFLCMCSTDHETCWCCCTFVSRYISSRSWWTTHLKDMLRELMALLMVHENQSRNSSQFTLGNSKPL